MTETQNFISLKDLHIHSSWHSIFEPLLPELEQIVRHLALMQKNNRTVFPVWSKIFKAFELTSLNSCRVVLLGQDPYPQPQVATGLAFANRKTTPLHKISPSLKVLLEAVEADTGPLEGIQEKLELTQWASQGVLLLNSSLTVEVRKPGSHVVLWKPFFNKLLQLLDTEDSSLLFVALGKQAADYARELKNTDVLFVKHPATDAYNGTEEFKKAKLFSKINGYLTQPIQWSA